jgi:hypothetical protein
MCRIHVYSIQPLACPMRCRHPVDWSFRVRAPNPSRGLELFYGVHIQYAGLPCQIDEIDDTTVRP